MNVVQLPSKSRKAALTNTVFRVRCVLRPEDEVGWAQGPIADSAGAVSLLRDIRDSDREHLVVICLSTANFPVAISTVSIGSVNRAHICPSELVRVAILAGTPHLVVAHNHPSGLITPSQSDRLLTERLVQACELMGLRLLDHVIVGASNENHYSFADHGELSSR